MKKLIISTLIIFLTCFDMYAQSVTLERAIQITVENLEKGVGQTSSDNAASFADSALKEMESDQTDFDSIRQRAQNFSQRPIIAVLSFKSQSTTLSEYIVDELSLALASSNRFTVVDRQRLDVIRIEENFQMSGEVSDKTAQSIGKKLGAQYVITGSMQDMGNNYRFRVVPLHVETAIINSPTTLNINKNDRQIRNFLNSNSQKSSKPSTVVKNIPKQPKKPVEINPVFNFGLGIGGGKDVGLDIELLCFQAGLNVGRFEFLIEAIAGPSFVFDSPDDGSFGYHIGGILEYRFFDKAVLGLGGGYGGQAVYSGDTESISYPYIKGSASIILGICKFGAFYDYCFDYGSRFGVRGIFEITRIFW
ncbi:MAG: penicillin-binding protein activator LpoB [Treponema sp.]|jgi:TolB-like protein|nr:penicillin-binding protein activator LpoB [Treponema sp.]